MTQSIHAEKLVKYRKDKAEERNNELVYSYRTLRNLIGFSGMLLPLVLVLFTKKIGADKLVEPSISDYYYTSTGDVLVVMLSVLGVFLITYNGYNWKEKLLTNFAAICGMGVAFSPTTCKYTRASLSIHSPQFEVPVLLGVQRHFLFAGCFFLAVAIMSLVFFPKSPDFRANKVNGRYTQKGKRNVVYLATGSIIMGCLAVLAVYFFWPAFQNRVGNFPIILVGETVAIEAFAVSWLTKGQTFFPDGRTYIQQAISLMKVFFRRKQIDF